MSLSTTAGAMWAIAIHGGAGARPRAGSDDGRRDAERGLSRALAAGRDVLAASGSALEAVEVAVRILEDEPAFNAGRGAVLAADGSVELDASIMDGRDRRCGAVAAVRRVRHPVALARAVMEHTPHVLLVGDGAEALAVETGLERVDPGYFVTEQRRSEWRVRPSRRGEVPSDASDPAGEGTVGAVAVDRAGHLAAATSTGGIAGKRVGRVGDSAVIGAGTWADDATAAVSGTGIGEEFIRHAVARSVAARMELLGEPVERAVRHLVDRTLRPGQGGLIAVDARGRLVAAFNTDGMYHGAADEAGRFEVTVG